MDMYLGVGLSLFWGTFIFYYFQEDTYLIRWIPDFLLELEAKRMHLFEFWIKNQTCMRAYYYIILLLEQPAIHLYYNLIPYSETEYLNVLISKKSKIERLYCKLLSLCNHWFETCISFWNSQEISL